MRLIGIINDEASAKTFSRFLDQQKIRHHLDVEKDLDWGSHNYGTIQSKVWIEDEDQVDEAVKYYQLFLENPHDPLFQKVKLGNVPIHPHPPASEPSPTLWEKQPMGPITRFFLYLCALIFIAGQFIPTGGSEKNSPVEKAVISFFSSPIDKAMLYDYPYYYELIDRFITLYGIEGLEKPEEAPVDAQYLMKKINQTPYWQGYYHLILTKGFISITDWSSYPPMFEKIKQGQLWRLFSPCLLHGDIFHIFFNMLWLIVLGKQIEQRLKPMAYIALIVILGVFSDTAQYLMSGPNFIGFSGILVGMLTFVWIRQRNAPWEGYTIDRSTFIFMAVFIGAMAAIQFFSFVAEKTLHISFAPNIANMAHLSGALGGIILGKLNIFSWRQG